MTSRWFALVPAVVVVRALRVRLTVAGRRRYWDTQRFPTDFRLIALGDSLTQGIGSSQPETSWLGTFRGALADRTGRVVGVDNRAVYGAKVADVLATQLAGGLNADLVTLCIGSNDAGRTAPEKFAADLRRLCALLPPGSIVGDVPEFQWGPRIAAAATLSAVVRGVVADFPELVLAEVERHTVGTRILTELAGDFFHPADGGYRRIAAAFDEAAVGLRRRERVGERGAPRPAGS